MTTRAIALCLGLALPLGHYSALAAENDLGQSSLVADDIHLAVVEDRNTPFLVGDTAVLLAETNFLRNAEAVSELIAAITPNPVRLVVNSHWHPDHVGGNALFAAAGAITLAHENTRTQMRERQLNQGAGRVLTDAVISEEDFTAYLPALTFTTDMRLHWDEEVVDLVYYPDAHTDSDVVMYFRNSNVVYIGGLMNYPMYAGVFRVDGFLDGLDQVIAATDANTKIIPWRGPVVSQTEVREWRYVLATVSATISTLIDQGMSLEQAIAARPSQEFDAKWGKQRAPERFVQDIYTALSAEP